MKELQTILYNVINWSEIFTALIAIIYFKKLYHSYWKWFVIYIIIITLIDVFGDYGLNYYPSFKKYYYDFFVIPIEFIFFYWLYAKKSLQNEKLFKISISVYLVFFFLHLFILDEIRKVSSMSYTVGVLFLAIMVYLEFIKQIKSDEILDFKSNKMFYINIGVLLFYVGTLPFFAFDKLLYENVNYLWNIYKTFFLFSVNVMYLLFAASFIWGKPKP